MSDDYDTPRKPGYHTHGDPYSDPPRAPVCDRCGALVGDQDQHDTWHQPPCPHEQPCPQEDTGYPWCIRCQSHHRHPETCDEQP